VILDFRLRIVEMWKAQALYPLFNTMRHAPSSMPAGPKVLGRFHSTGLNKSSEENVTLKDRARFHYSR
jgi:hypothetical protein